MLASHAGIVAPLVSDPDAQRGALTGWMALMKGEMAKAKLNPKVKKAFEGRLDELAEKLMLK